MGLKMIASDHEFASYPEDLYKPATVAPGIPTLADIGDRELAYFRSHGYLRVLEAFNEDRIANAIEGILAVLGKPGEVDVQYEAGDEIGLHELSPHERQDRVRRLMGFVSAEERLGALAGDELLVGVLYRLIGSDSLTMFQDMALLKPPGRGREKPWHQDLAFFQLETATQVVGVWIALDDATVENGCMHLIPGSHREGPRPHVRRRDFQICDIDVPRPEITAAPLPRGGALLFHGLLLHGTPANRTPDARRRAVQLHYAPSDAVRISLEERLAVFGPEGADARC